MRGLGLERPPGWGTVLLLIAVVVNVGLFSLMALRPTPPDTYSPGAGARAAAATNPAPEPADGSPPTESPAISVPDEPPLLAVYGDGYAAGNEFGGLGAAGWPALVAEQTGMRLALNAVSRAGYASVGATGQTIRDVVQAGPVADAAVTILFGSRNDAGEDVTQVRANAAEAISAVRSRAPQTTVVLIGPVWDDGAVPADILAARDAVRSAALESGVSFVDPVQAGWFADQAGLIAADGVSPNDQGHAYLAGVIAPAVEAAMAGAGQPQPAA
jgi:hypothetical protein